MTIQPTINLTVTPEQQAAADAFKPGVYDLTPDEYHADPVPGGSLSSTGVRKLTHPSVPARFKYDLDHPAAPKSTFELGTAAHTLVLGKGAGIARIDADSWRTNAAKDAAAEARAEGKVPLLDHDYLIVEQMAKAIKAHPFAAKLLSGAAGKSEQALIWRDARTGVMCRAMIDFLRDPHPDRRTILTDYKTAADASEEGFAKAMHNYGYHQQAPWYRDGVKALGLDGSGEEPVFLYVVQEKSAPYLVNVVQPDPTAMMIGAHLNRLAVDTYKECKASGVWPGYGTEPKMISLPSYVERQYEKEPWMT